LIKKGEKIKEKRIAPHVFPGQRADSFSCKLIELIKLIEPFKPLAPLPKKQEICFLSAIGGQVLSFLNFSFLIFTF
jgi:hypothetical protein